jgi:hypothetical protein
LLSFAGSPVRRVDVADARRRGIAICNTPNAFSEPVADTVLGYALLFVRQLGRMNADMHEGLWQKPQLRSLSELTLGIPHNANSSIAAECVHERTIQALLDGLSRPVQRSVAV